jgi:hypothetical protein
VVDLSTTAAPDGTYQVFARLVNFSDRPVSRGVSLVVDGETVDSYNYVMPPNSVAPQVWYQEGEPMSVAVVLAGGDALVEDDTASGGFQPGKKASIEVVEETAIPVTGENPALNKSAVVRGVETAAGFAVEPVPADEYFERPATDLTVFHNTSVARYPAGISLVVIPPLRTQDVILPEGVLAAGSTVVVPASAVLQAAGDHPLLAGLDFSGVRWGAARTLTAEEGGFVPLVSAQFEGKTLPLLLSKSTGQGEVYLLTADLSRGNLTRHPVFPIMLAKMAQAAVRNPLPEQIQLGEEIVLPPAGSYLSVALTPPGQPRQVFPSGWPRVWEATFSPGEYRFEYEDRDGSTRRFSIGVNAGSLSESDISPREWVNRTGFGEDPSTREAGEVDLTPWLLGLAIVCLLLEAVLAWR